MESLRKVIALRSAKIINIILVSGIFACFCFFCFVPNLIIEFASMERLAIAALFLILYVLFARVYDAFLISQCRISEAIFSQILAAILADLISYFMIGLLMRGIPSVIIMLLIPLLQSLVIVAWCYFAHQWYFKLFPPKRSAIIYGDRYDFDALIHEYGLEKKFQIEKTVPIESFLSDPWWLDGMEALFLAGIPSHERNQVLKHCVYAGVQAYVLPNIGDVIMSGAARTHMFHLPILRVGRCTPTPEYLFMKRFFDVACSAVALLLLMPLMLLIAVAVKLCDGGKVFYRQQRLTKNGRLFWLVKFRSMKPDAEANGIPRLSSGAQDHRVTAVGRILRRFRLDELPQLWNILKGDMSIVGPRPERPELAEEIEQTLPEFQLRLQVKAGLTGYAQVYGKYNSTPYDKLKMDLMYIANPSFFEDIRICFATIKVLFEVESTDGVRDEADNTTDKREEMVVR